MRTVVTMALLVAVAVVVAPRAAGAAPPAKRPQTDAPSPPATSAVPSAAQLVRRVASFYRGIEGFRADFTQEVHRRYRPGASRASRQSRGVVYFSPPAMMRWDYETPSQIYYITDGKVLWVYDVEERVAYRGQVAHSRIGKAMRFLLGDTDDLLDSFSASVGKADAETVELVLTPRKGEQDLKKLVLVVDRRTYAVRASTVTDPAGDVSVIRFDNVTYGPIANPEWFHWKPTGDIRVEDLDKLGADKP